MRNKFELQDYEPVTPSGSRRHPSSPDTDGGGAIRAVEPIVVINSPAKFSAPAVPQTHQVGQSQSRAKEAQRAPIPALKKGHSLTYLGLFVFTFLVYFRPYELFPSLAWLSRSALVIAVLTLALFIPTQLGLENMITAWTREVKLALGLLLTGLFSIPFALEPSHALQSLVEFLKVIVMFIVMVNVVRTEKRLRRLILLVLSVSCVLSLAALNDYAHGNLALQGRRIAGLIGGLFSNPNDLALHLVTMIPISLTLFLGSRGPLRKSLYLMCSLLLMVGMVATFSRGGFLGFVCVIGFLAWKLAHRNRVVFGAVALIVVLAGVALAPSAYRTRLATTSDDSAAARTDDLKRSILVAARHPLFGVGMDNYILYSNMNKATHNAYTQVAAEMGVAAFLIYVWFLVSPFKSLRRIERATGTSKRKSTVYYLAIGLQASLVGYMVVSFFASVAYLWYVYYLVAYGICLRRIYADVAADPASASNSKRKSAVISAGRQSSLLDKTVVVGGN
jgi:probable O-glycosylation ligase (exosortase A-associated)